MKTIKILATALGLTLGAGFTTAASADTFAAHTAVTTMKVQYNTYRGSRDYDRDRVPNRSYQNRGRDRDNDRIRNRWDRNDYRANDGHYRRGHGAYGYGFAPTRYSRSWDWDGDGVPNRRDARPRNPRRW